jgi:ABC-2 type transport system permease protein
MIALALWQVRYEQRAFWRNRRWTLFTFAFPVMLLLVFGYLNHGTTLDTRGNISFVTFFVPGILAYALVSTAFSNLAMSFSAARMSGMIKRVQGTPLPWASYVAGRIGSVVITVAVMTALVLGLGWLLFGVDIPFSTLPGLVLALILGTAALASLGVAFAGVLPTPEAAGPMQAVFVMPISFISGTFFPLDGAPSWLHDVARVFPLQPLADALQVAFDPRTTGVGIAGTDLLLLGGWTVAGAFLAHRFLRTLTRRA